MYGGTPSRHRQGLGAHRSIPACTGEPLSDVWKLSTHRVYPRVYGGTTLSIHAPEGVGGLSPRVRGNPHSVEIPDLESRSIPACTGEPWTTAGFKRVSRVYPRVYGGTRAGSEDRFLVRGLSPRVRGNPWLPAGPPVTWRSIPACTGEPCSRAAGRAGPGVYPRVYGGTERWGWVREKRLGLSPRVRGNPRRELLPGDSRRSIPACTGEPLHDRQARVSVGVYPRVYGGTDVCRGRS